MKIKNRISVMLLTIATIPVIFIAAAYFFSGREALLRASVKQLEVLADLKAKVVQDFFGELKNDVRIAQDYYNIKMHLPLLIKSYQDITGQEFVEAKKVLDEQLSIWLETRKYVNDIMLVNLEGKIVYAANKKYLNLNLGAFLPDSQGEVFQAGKKGVFISRIFRSSREEHGYKFGLLVTAPAFDFEERLIGEVVFEINMDYIFKLIQDYTGLGESGETLVVHKEGEKVLFLVPLRHDPDAALKRSVRLGSRLAIPAQKSAQGQEGSGVTRDYRDVEVLTAWRYMPMMDWGMVAKIDLREVLVPIIKLRNQVILFCLILVIFILIVSSALAESVSRPIHVLRKGIEIIGSGNLDYKVGVSAKDEIGEFARAFDRMTQNLKSITVSRDVLRREIAEREEAQEKLQEKSRELNRSNAELQQFAYIASHDLKEPLRMVISYLGLISDRYKEKLDSDADEFIHYAVDGASRMQELITDLLEYSRLNTQSRAFALTDCNEVLALVLNNLQVSIKESNARIINEGLPKVMADSTQLMQLFQNLISNSIKFKTKDKEITVWISAKRQDKDWVFSVKDNGIGFDMQYAGKIFIIFQRLHARREYTGTGIGLAIVKKIVELHGGRIWVESKEGEGATFYFTIPETMEVKDG